MLKRAGKVIAKQKFRAIAMPSDLESITAIDDGNEVGPAQAGLSKEAHD